MDLLMGIFSAFGLSASAGLNAYIPLLVVSLVARFTDLIELNAPWDTLSDGWVIGLLIVLSVIEFFADKVPAVNHINDAIQTVVRPAAGRRLFLRPAPMWSPKFIPFWRWPAGCSSRAACMRSKRPRGAAGGRPRRPRGG